MIDFLIHLHTQMIQSTERTKTYTTGPDVVHAVQFVGISAGHTVFVTFKKKFIAPTNQKHYIS